MSEAGRVDDAPLRLTKYVREALLRANEGFTDSTYYSAKNFSETRNYEIADGELRVNSRSKTSWADSRQEHDFVADEAATHRFLRERLPSLSTDGVLEQAAAIKAAEKAERAASARRPAAADTDEDELDPSVVDDSEGADSSGRGTKAAIVAAAVTIAAAVVVAPRAKRAWQAKGKPRVEAWRARRSAKNRLQPDDTAEADC